MIKSKIFLQAPKGSGKTTWIFERALKHSRLFKNQKQIKIAIIKARTRYTSQERLKTCAENGIMIYKVESLIWMKGLDGNYAKEMWIFIDDYNYISESDIEDLMHHLEESEISFNICCIGTSNMNRITKL